MNALFITFIALAAAGAGWWLHHSRVRALREQLREAQDSRLDLAATAATLHRRLAEADHALSILPTLDDAVPGDAAQRRAALERALAAAGPAQGGWEDTHPLTMPGFMPTQPAPLDELPPR